MNIKSKILVTGASGFAGRHICKLRLQQKCEVLAIVRRDDVYLKSLGVQICIADLWDREKLSNSLVGINYVIHCAGDAVFGNGKQYNMSNYELTKHILNEINSNNVKINKFIYISTIGAVDRCRSDICSEKLNELSIPNPTSDYGISKLNSEILVRESGINYVIIRPSMVVGPDMRKNSHFAVFIRYALSNSIVSKFDWPGAFSVVHVDDLASAIIQAAFHPRVNYETLFCSGEEIVLGDLFKKINPKGLMIKISFVVKFFKSIVAYLPFKVKAMLLPALVANDQKLRLLGWQPKHVGDDIFIDLIKREAARINPKSDINGQTVITGAASGLGLALLKKLYPYRQNILLIDKDETSLSEITKIFPKCRSLIFNLEEYENFEKMYTMSEWTEYPINELYACAGIGYRGKTADIDLKKNIDIFSVNILARLSMAHEVIKQMRLNQFGRIVFISSSSAFQPLPYMAAYAASNCALLSLGESWAYENCDEGIQFKVICPGGMQTNFQDHSGVKKIKGEKLMSPDQVASIIFDNLYDNDISILISFRSKAMNFVARILPRVILTNMWGNLMGKMR